MEGKFLLILVLLSSASFLTACGTTKSSGIQTATASCENKVVPKSFIVEWKRNEVPKEFETYQLHKGSRYTRFTNVDKETVNREVMYRYPEKIILGESDMRIEIEKADMRPAQANDIVTSFAVASNWGFSNVEAEAAWSTLNNKSGDGIVVAVVDSGVDLTHPALSGQFYINPGETGVDAQGKDKRTNGIDDDKNGFIDDVTGYDFGDSDSDVTDHDGHGTHVSGIVGGRRDSSVTGVAPNAKLLPIKFLSDRGIGYLGSALQSLEYAQQMGATVVNASWGGSSCASALQDEVTNLSGSGVIMANSAGNSGHDLTRLPEWPAAYQAPNKITVGSSERNNLISDFSNFGLLTDLVAPGGDIVSTYKNGSFATLRGTSMSSPFVAGVAALIWSAYPEASAGQIVAAINESGINNNYPVRTRSRLNARNAAELLKSRMSVPNN